MLKSRWKGRNVDLSRYELSGQLEIRIRVEFRGQRVSCTVSCGKTHCSVPDGECEMSDWSTHCARPTIVHSFSLTGLMASEDSQDPSSYSRKVTSVRRIVEALRAHVFSVRKQRCPGVCLFVC